MRVHHLAILLLCILLMPAAQANERYSPSCGLGARWEVSESGWSGTWIRRGNSNTFDATWQKGGERGTSTLTMSLSGNRVTIQRQDAPSFGGGVHYTYDGTIAADGSFSGINSGTYPVKGTVRCGEALTPVSPTPPGTAAGSSPCGLGARWDVTESGWSGTWIRRGNSNTFDATWQKGGERGSSTLTMSLSGNRVTIQRQDAPSFGGGVHYTYDGTIAADGSFSGINSGTYPVKGTVRCGEVLSPEPPAPSTTSDPGATLVVVYPNVCVAIWTRARPGVYDAVTVCQGPNTTSFREVLTVEAYDGRNVTINRPNYGRYRGTLSADRRTITGICNWKGCTADADWTAYVDLDWRRSPQLK